MVCRLGERLSLSTEPFSEMASTRSLFETAQWCKSRTSFTANQLLKHRFCWIPAPITIDRDDVNETDLAELVDQGLEGAGLRVLDDDTAGDDLLHIAPVRFDYDLDSHGEDHAACHLTFNRPSCRVPVFGPLSLGHFVRFVFRNFYPDEWSAEPRLRAWALRFGARMITAAQEGEIFVECRQGGRLLARMTAQPPLLTASIAHGWPFGGSPKHLALDEGRVLTFSTPAPADSSNTRR